MSHEALLIAFPGDHIAPSSFREDRCTAARTVGSSRTIAADPSAIAADVLDRVNRR